MRDFEDVEIIGMLKSYAKKSVGSIEGVERKKVYTPADITLIAGSYVYRVNGKLIQQSLFSYCEIPVTKGERYLITVAHSQNCAVYAFYDSSDRFIEAYPTFNIPNETSDSVEVTIPEGVAMMRCSGLTSNNRIFKVYKVTDGSGYDIKNVNDVLYGKKWFACGDSFTAGDFRNYIDSEGHILWYSDAFDDKIGRYKTYPYWICQRTGMVGDWNTCAYAGIDFTNVEGSTSPFSSEASARNYTMIPSDCDYITLQFGLNELNLTTEQIGTSADTTNATLWGAYNVVLTSILTANPKVKIGIIISDASMCGNTTYYNALKDIAEYWGIPYLDLSGGDVEVPMMINRRGTVSEFAKEKREGVFAINYPTDQHPTPEGHKYRSTVIENFLRSL